MSTKEIPIDKMNLLQQWFTLSDQLKKIREEEMALRKEMFNYFFPKPKQGTNKADLGDGYELVGKYNLDYEMDYDKFCDLCKKDDAPMTFEEVVDYEPKFVLKRFKELDSDGQKFVTEALTIKPAAPSMEIIQKTGWTSTILQTIYFDNGAECYEMEQSLHKEFKEFRYQGEKILYSGNTELFTKNILDI